MKRTIIAAATVAGATVPALFGTVFIFGCCVLPFHQVMHKLMPVCQLAAQLMSGDQQPASGDPVEAPSREKQPNAKELLPAASGHVVLNLSSKHVARTPSLINGYRSFIAQGALRCDDDIGLHLLGKAFLI